MHHKKLFIACIVILMVVIIVIGVMSLNTNNKSNFNKTNDISTVNAGLNIPFTLKINQTAVITTENLKIKFLNVTEDSRCPSDVQCVWSGQAKVQINIVNNDRNVGTFNLTKRTGYEELSILKIDGYSITLEQVDPYPISTKKIESNGYSITLKIKKI